MKFLISEKLSQHKYKTPEGYLVCIDAILARTGKQSYRRSEVFADGDDEIIEIDRLPEEVFSAQTLASFENKPITVEHPDEDVNSENYKEYAVGFVRDVHRGVVDGQEVILGTLVITDAQTIEEIENGEHTDLSCGYDCDIVDEANPQQRNIRGNHVALCAEGRAGNARIVDSKKVKDDKNTKVVFVNDRTKIVQVGTQGRTYAQKVGSSWYIMKQGQTLFRADNENDAYNHVRAAADINDSIKDEISLTNGQIQDLKTYAKHYDYDWQEIMDGLNSRIKREHMTIVEAIEDIKESMVENKSLYDSKCKDVNPREGETKEEFISRFMSETKEEYPDEKQRFAVANSYWEKKDMKDSLNFDRIAECDFCGEKTNVAITHYGTGHYNRLVCKECAKELKIEDSQSCKDETFKKGDKVKIANDFHVYSLRGAEGIVEYIDEYINVRYTSGPAKGNIAPFTSKSLIKLNDSVKDARWKTYGQLKNGDKIYFYGEKATVSNVQIVGKAKEGKYAGENVISFTATFDKDEPTSKFGQYQGGRYQGVESIQVEMQDSSCKDSHPLVSEVAEIIKPIESIFDMRKALEQRGFKVEFYDGVLWVMKNGKKVMVVSKNRVDVGPDDIVQGNYAIGLNDSKMKDDNINYDKIWRYIGNDLEIENKRGEMRLINSKSGNTYTYSHYPKEKAGDPVTSTKDEFMRWFCNGRTAEEIAKTLAWYSDYKNVTSKDITDSKLCKDSVKDEYETFTRKWVADYKFGNSLVHLFKFIRKNDPSYVIYTTDPNGNQSMGSSENEAIRLKEKWTGEKAVLVERNTKDSKMKDAVLTPADKQMIDDVISTVKIKTLANILDALNEQIPGFVGSYGQCVIEYINGKGIKDSKYHDAEYIGNAKIVNELPKIGEPHPLASNMYGKVEKIEKIKTQGNYTIYYVYYHKEGETSHPYFSYAIKDSKMYEIKWKSGKDSYKSTLSGKGLNDAINKFKDSLKSRGLKSGSIEIKSIKCNDSIVELNSKLDKVIKKDLDGHMKAITLTKVTKDSCKENIDVEDDRLSPMTYKKLKEMGYNSDRWENLTQEEANKIVQKHEEKGGEKSSNNEEKSSNKEKNLNKAIDIIRRSNSMAEPHQVADILKFKVYSSDMSMIKRAFKKELPNVNIWSDKSGVTSYVYMKIDDLDKNV